MRNGQLKEMQIRHVRRLQILIIVPRLKESLRRRKIRLQSLKRIPINSRQQLPPLKPHFIRKPRPNRHRPNSLQILPLPPRSLILPPKHHRHITIIKQLRKTLNIPPIRLKHLSDAHVPHNRTQQIRKQSIRPARGTPVRQFPEFGPAVLAAGGLEAAGLIGAAGGFHYHGAVAGFGEEVVVAWVLEAATTLNFAGWDGFGDAVGAVGELELEF